MFDDFEAALRIEQAGRRRIESGGRAAILELQARRRDRITRWALVRTPRLRRQAVRPGEGLPTLSRMQISKSFESSVADPTISLAGLAAFFRAHPNLPYLHRYQVFRSAGRSGDLCYFIYDRHMWRHFIGSYVRALGRPESERRDGHRIAWIGSEDPAHTQYRLCRAFPAGASRAFGLQRPFWEIVSALNSYQPTALVGFSSALALLAESQLEGRLKLRPTRILANTDLLDDGARRQIERAWGVGARSMYGMTELGVIAGECGEGRAHLNEDLVLLEADGAQPTATNLVNRIQPFVRYVLPDRVVSSSSGCRCGSPFQCVLVPEGRRGVVLTLPAVGGGLAPVHSISLRSALDSTPGLEASRVAQSGDTVVVTVVGAVDAAAARRAVLHALTAAGAVVSAGQVEIEVEH